jgi:hypothetical protein
VGVFDVELVHDGGKKLKFGPIAVMSRSEAPNGFDSEKNVWDMREWFSGCLDGNAKAISDVLQTPHVTASDELKSLDKWLRSRP